MAGHSSTLFFFFGGGVHIALWPCTGKITSLLRWKPLQMKKTCLSILFCFTHITKNHDSRAKVRDPSPPSSSPLPPPSLPWVSFGRLWPPPPPPRNSRYSWSKDITIYFKEKKVFLFATLQNRSKRRRTSGCIKRDKPGLSTNSHPRRLRLLPLSI